jgi:hypothetical protein
VPRVLEVEARMASDLYRFGQGGLLADRRPTTCSSVCADVKPADQTLLVRFFHFPANGFFGVTCFQRHLRIPVSREYGLAIFERRQKH